MTQSVVGSITYFVPPRRCGAACGRGTWPSRKTKYCAELTTSPVALRPRLGSSCSADTAVNAGASRSPFGEYHRALDCAIWGRIGPGIDPVVAQEHRTIHGL